MGQLAASSGDPAGSLPGDQYLTFRLGEEEYGVPILAVHEIKGESAITPIPNAPAYLSGVMNLRGTVVPVVDLRVKFKLPQVERSRFTVIVLVVVGARIVGMVVDAATDVRNFPASEIQAVPEIAAPVEAGFVSGFARAGEKLFVLLDLARVLDGDAQLAPPSVT
jgi:purine-binding chemotaxis protein CheW